jgi:N-acetylneuraminic acid mutarotase
LLLNLVLLLELCACGTPSRWRMVMEMPEPRSAHTATLLTDGTVLVTGGFDGLGGVRDSAVRYDPQKNTWSSAGKMSSPRVAHTATLLDNGMVLVAGGVTATATPTPLVTSAQLYDPKGNTWTEVGPMTLGRALYMAVKLNDGTVLRIGGGSTGSIDTQRSVERFDPTNKKWLPVESMIEPHIQGAAALLDDGTVIVAGGAKYGKQQNDPTQTVVPFSERFSPISGHWGEWALLNDSPLVPGATALGDGTVLITGGQISGKNVVRYDRTRAIPNVSPQPNMWQIMATLHVARSNHQATLMGNNDVLVTGGHSGCQPQGCSASLRSVEQYNVKANTWTTLDNMFFFRGGHTATRLKDGSLLVVGGFNWSAGTATATCELYPPL